MFIMGGGKKITPVTVTYTANASSSANASSYTYTAQSIGSASSDRVVIVGVTGVNVQASAVTVGGISASKIATATDGATENVTLWTASVPTGTTADIVVTMTGSEVRNGIAVWSKVGGVGSTTVATTGAVSNGPATTSINVPSNGGLVAMVVWAGSGSTPSATWAGPTLDYNSGTIEASTGASGASKNYTSAQTGLTVTATNSSSTSWYAMAVAAFG